MRVGEWQAVRRHQRIVGLVATASASHQRSTARVASRFSDIRIRASFATQFGKISESVDYHRLSTEIYTSPI